MSIASEITRLQTAKANLKTSLEAKGATIASDATIDTYPTVLDDIPVCTLQDKQVNVGAGSTNTISSLSLAIISISPILQLKFLSIIS